MLRRWRFPQSQLAFLTLICLAMPSRAGAQSFELPAGDLSDAAVQASTMPRLATEVIAAYHEADRRKFLDNLFRLQIVAGQNDAAAKSLAELRALNTAGDASKSPKNQATNAQFEIYLTAKAREAGGSGTFAEAFAQAFRERLAETKDAPSGQIIRAVRVGLRFIQDDLNQDIGNQKGNRQISLADALKLLRHYQMAATYGSFAALVPPLVAEDDARRYIMDKDIAVKMRDGATVCALIVRPRAATAKLTTLLTFTIYADPEGNLAEARRTASLGYAGVIGLTRGKGCSPDPPVPYEHDGADAAALIDWLAAQPWSDGRVGMYGGSYSGFTEWAAAKYMPKALKAMAPSVPACPGIDVPMEGNVFWSFVYPWTFYTMNVKNLDNATYGDRKRWINLDRNWYSSGRPWRDLDKIDGTPNPVFDRWIDHPSYDSYWQGMVPFEREFARINIPVLATAGYYLGGPGAAMYFFTQHYNYNPRAEHYLVIGPYDHFGGQRGTWDALGDSTSSIAGYTIDPVAHVDLVELRYQFFDYVFRGAPRPTLLADRVNYQVTGANEWKHAPSVAAMSRETLRYHLSSQKSGDAQRLSPSMPTNDELISQTINLADRSDIDLEIPGGAIFDKALNAHNGIEFISEPFAKPAEVSGLFSGELDFIANKKDFDFDISLYEQIPTGEYVFLTSYWARASYVSDLTRRRLLVPDTRQRLNFQCVRLMSRQLQAGSRLVVVLSVIKQPGQQINFGTGKDVSDESAADGKEPLKIRWFSDSFLDIPVTR